MANIYPFRPLRYTAKAGQIENLATQPYDTIPPQLAEYYRGLGPHNLVHILLPGGDYAGAGARFREWICKGALAADEAPALFVYEQRFRLPETDELLVRRGFIGLGDCEQYGATVHRHERTLDAPKADRLELLRYTRAQFGSIFMLYEDRNRGIESLLDAASSGSPLERFTDCHGTIHTLWRIADAHQIVQIQTGMRDKKLVIADGHHRYEAALLFQREQPDLSAARLAMMTFVNVDSPGLRSLAAHRMVFGLATFPSAALTAIARPLASVQELSAAWNSTPASRVRFGLALPDGLCLLELQRPADSLNLTVLHREVLEALLGIRPDDIAAERFVRYQRGIENAVAEVRSGAAQAALLVEPLRVEDVARLALSGETLPQKSTDFYPKMQSGLTIYSLDA